MKHQWQDTTEKHFGSAANGRQAARLEVGQKSASVRTTNDGYLLIKADGIHGKGSDMYTVEVVGRETFATWDEAVAAGEQWVS